MRGSFLCALLLVAAPLAQHDRRDVVVLNDGKRVEGRVLDPFADDVIVVLEGNKRRRVAVDRVQSMDLVRTRLAEFLEKRRAGRRNAAYHWMLAEWALAHELEAMARLQALTVVLLDDTHQKAHELLGHREHPRRGWLWPEGSRWLTREQLEEHHSKWGRALELDSEHFRIRTDGGLQRAVDALFDLEHLYVFFFDTYGDELGLHESIGLPMQLHAWNDETRFPAWASIARIPYFVPNPHADTGYTFWSGTDPRPVDLFTVGTQMLLYRCLAKGADPGGPQERFCATAEIGLGRYLQSRFRGDPGLAEAKAPQVEPYDLDLAANHREYGLENLIHLSLREHFYGGARGGPAVHWSTAQLFVHFLMDEGVDPAHRGRFLAFLRAALGEGKGDSSSAFDAAFGFEIERLEAPFRTWLRSHGAPERRGG